MIVILQILEQSIVEKCCKFYLYELRLIGISNRGRVPSNGSILRFYVTKAKCSISRLSKVEKENRHDDEIEDYNQCAHPKP
jgi:hypothetical protein